MLVKKIELDNTHVGLSFGGFFVLIHAAWSLTVGLGFGQTLVDLFHSMHFLTGMSTVAGFSLGAMITGLPMAFVSGYVAGWIFAAVWNFFGRKL